MSLAQGSHKGLNVTHASSSPSDLDYSLTTSQQAEKKRAPLLHYKFSRRLGDFAGYTQSQQVECLTEANKKCTKLNHWVP